MFSKLFKNLYDSEEQNEILSNNGKADTEKKVSPSSQRVNSSTEKDDLFYLALAKTVPLPSANEPTMEVRDISMDSDEDDNEPALPKTIKRPKPKRNVKSNSVLTVDQNPSSSTPNKKDVLVKQPHSNPPSNTSSTLPSPSQQPKDKFHASDPVAMSSKTNPSKLDLDSRPKKENVENKPLKTNSPPSSPVMAMGKFLQMNPNPKFNSSSKSVQDFPQTITSIEEDMEEQLKTTSPIEPQASLPTASTNPTSTHAPIKARSNSLIETITGWGQSAINEDFEKSANDHPTDSKPNSHKQEPKKDTKSISKMAEETLHQSRGGSNSISLADSPRNIEAKTQLKQEANYKKVVENIPSHVKDSSTISTSPLRSKAESSLRATPSFQSDITLSSLVGNKTNLPKVSSTDATSENLALPSLNSKIEKSVRPIQTQLATDSNLNSAFSPTSPSIPYSKEGNIETQKNLTKSPAVKDSFNYSPHSPSSHSNSNEIFNSKAPLLNEVILEPSTPLKEVYIANTKEKKQVENVQNSQALHSVPSSKTLPSPTSFLGVNTTSTKSSPPQSHTQFTSNSHQTISKPNAEVEKMKDVPNDNGINTVKPKNNESGTASSSSKGFFKSVQGILWGESAPSENILESAENGSNVGNLLKPNSTESSALLKRKNSAVVENSLADSSVPHSMDFDTPSLAKKRKEISDSNLTGKGPSPQASFPIPASKVNQNFVEVKQKATPSSTENTEAVALNSITSKASHKLPGNPKEAINLKSEPSTTPISDKKPLLGTQELSSINKTAAPFVDPSYKPESNNSQDASREGLINSIKGFLWGQNFKSEIFENDSVLPSSFNESSSNKAEENGSRSLLASNALTKSASPIHSQNPKPSTHSKSPHPLSATPDTNFSNQTSIPSATTKRSIPTTSALAASELVASSPVQKIHPPKFDSPMPTLKKSNSSSIQTLNSSLSTPSLSSTTFENMERNLSSKLSSPIPLYHSIPGGLPSSSSELDSANDSGSESLDSFSTDSIASPVSPLDHPQVLNTQNTEPSSYNRDGWFGFFKGNHISNKNDFVSEKDAKLKVPHSVTSNASETRPRATLETPFYLRETSTLNNSPNEQMVSSTTTPSLKLNLTQANHHTDVRTGVKNVEANAMVSMPSSNSNISSPPLTDEKKIAISSSFFGKKRNPFQISSSVASEDTFKLPVDNHNSKSLNPAVTKYNEKEKNASILPIVDSQSIRHPQISSESYLPYINTKTDNDFQIMRFEEETPLPGGWGLSMFDSNSEDNLSSASMSPPIDTYPPYKPIHTRENERQFNQGKPTVTVSSLLHNNKALNNGKVSPKLNVTDTSSPSPNIDSRERSQLPATTPKISSFLGGLFGLKSSENETENTNMISNSSSPLNSSSQFSFSKEGGASLPSKSLLPKASIDLKNVQIEDTIHPASSRIAKVNSPVSHDPLPSTSNFGTSRGFFIAASNSKQAPGMPSPLPGSLSYSSTDFTNFSPEFGASLSNSLPLTTFSKSSSSISEPITAVSSSYKKNNDQSENESWSSDSDSDSDVSSEKSVSHSFVSSTHPSVFGRLFFGNYSGTKPSEAELEEILSRGVDSTELIDLTSSKDSDSEEGSFSPPSHSPHPHRPNVNRNKGQTTNGLIPKHKASISHDNQMPEVISPKFSQKYFEHEEAKYQPKIISLHYDSNLTPSTSVDSRSGATNKINPIVKKKTVAESEKDLKPSSNVDSGLFGRITSWLSQSSSAIDAQTDIEEDSMEVVLSEVGTHPSFSPRSDSASEYEKLLLPSSDVPEAIYQKQFIEPIPSLSSQHMLQSNSYLASGSNPIAKGPSSSSFVQAKKPSPNSYKKDHFLPSINQLNTAEPLPVTTPTFPTILRTVENKYPTASFPLSYESSSDPHSLPLSDLHEEAPQFIARHTSPANMESGFKNVKQHFLPEDSKTTRLERDTPISNLSKVAQSSFTMNNFHGFDEFAYMPKQSALASRPIQKPSNSLDDLKKPVSVLNSSDSDKKSKQEFENVSLMFDEYLSPPVSNSYLYKNHINSNQGINTTELSQSASKFNASMNSVSLSKPNKSVNSLGDTKFLEEFRHQPAAALSSDEFYSLSDFSGSISNPVFVGPNSNPDSKKGMLSKGDDLHVSKALSHNHPLEKQNHQNGNYTDSSTIPLSSISINNNTNSATYRRATGTAIDPNSSPKRSQSLSPKDMDKTDFNLLDLSFSDVSWTELFSVEEKVNTSEERHRDQPVLSKGHYSTRPTFPKHTLTSELSNTNLTANPLSKQTKNIEIKKSISVDMPESSSSAYGFGKDKKVVHGEKIISNNQPTTNQGSYVREKGQSASSLSLYSKDSTSSDTPTTENHNQRTYSKIEAQPSFAQNASKDGIFPLIRRGTVQEVSKTQASILKQADKESEPALSERSLGVIPQVKRYLTFSLPLRSDSSSAAEKFESKFNSNSDALGREKQEATPLKEEKVLFNKRYTVISAVKTANSLMSSKLQSNSEPTPPNPILENGEEKAQLKRYTTFGTNKFITSDSSYASSTKNLTMAPTPNSSLAKEITLNSEKKNAVQTKSISSKAPEPMMSPNVQVIDNQSQPSTVGFVRQPKQIQESSHPRKNLDQIPNSHLPNQNNLIDSDPVHTNTKLSENASQGVLNTNLKTDSVPLQERRRSSVRKDSLNRGSNPPFEQLVLYSPEIDSQVISPSPAPKRVNEGHFAPLEVMSKLKVSLPASRFNSVQTKPFNLTGFDQPITPSSEDFSDDESQVPHLDPCKVTHHIPEGASMYSIPHSVENPESFGPSCGCSELVRAATAFRQTLDSVIIAGEHLASVFESINNLHNHPRKGSSPEVQGNLLLLVDSLRLLSGTNDLFSKLIQSELEQSVKAFDSEDEMPLFNVVANDASSPSLMMSGNAINSIPIAHEAFYLKLLRSTEKFTAGALACYYNLGTSFRMLAELKGDTTTVSTEASHLFRQLPRLKHTSPSSVLSSTHLYGVGKVSRTLFGRKTHLFNRTTSTNFPNTMK